MIAEVISIGDEMTSGERLDTNSQWISRRLGMRGLTTLYHTTVGDDLQANVDVFRAAILRADVVAATGGLGPTADDLTREAIALAVGARLQLDERQLRRIAVMFERRGRDMPERNRLQATLPAGAEAIDNPNGTAPAIYMAVERTGRPPCHLFALPGVPAELFEIWEQTVDGRLGELFPASGVVVHRQIKCFGVGESHLEQMLPDLFRRDRTPRVGVTVSQATITIRIAAQGANREECLRAIEPTAALVYQRIGKLVFGEGDDELQHVAARMLVERGQTLAIIDCGAGGLATQYMADIPDGAKCLSASLVASDPAAALRLLEANDAVEANLSRQMQRIATASRERWNVDYALAIGPIPGASEPHGDTFFIALATNEGTMVDEASSVAHPDLRRPRGAKQALNFLRLGMLGEGAGTGER
jgi:nicotinamide-nucleotide amidase